MPKINSSPTIPPQAAIKPKRFTVHGDTRIDEYSWLRNTKDPAVGKYIREENDYADRMTRGTRKLQGELYREMRKRIVEDDTSVPVKDGPYLYYVRMKKGKQYAIHCRKKISDGKEEVILDENELAKGQKFFILGTAEIDPSHTLYAYTTDITGNEHYKLYIKDLRTGKLLNETILSVESVAWAEDGRHFFYTKEEHPYPPRQVWRHEVGTDSAKDVLVFQEKDIKWALTVEKSKSREYIFISCGTFKATEVWYLNAKDPFQKPKLIAPRKEAVRYFVDHHGEYFYILTDEKAVNFKIVRTSVWNLSVKSRETILPHKIERSISEMRVYKKAIVIVVRENGSEEIDLYDPVTWKKHRIKLKETGHSVSLWDDLEFDSPVIRFTYQSFLTPKTVFDYDIRRHTSSVKKHQKAPWWKKESYVSERTWVKNGNVRIPIHLIRKKNTKKDGSAPLYLYGYGSYGISTDPYFSSQLKSLLDRGWIFGIGNPRGGGEIGWHWHKKAYHLTKKITYFDFIACADYLVRKRYTSRNRLVIAGGSAGGMLIGAVLNLRPDLCKAAIAYVPAADLVTSLFDTSLGGTRLHFDEIGDPRKPKDYFYIKSHSPYENVQKTNYPALLVRASFHDIRTPFWEAAKWVARLRAKKKGSNVLLLKTEMSAGHFGKIGRYERLKQIAFDYAFLIDQIQHA